jgi:hydrogenase nickel incorporation protein HypA/HybF
VEADAFEQSFQLAAAGGPAEGATTELVVVPVHGHCLDCRTDFDTPDPAPACPSCGSLDVAVEGGDEVVLEWLQYVDTGRPADRPAELVPAHTHGEAG